MNLDKLTPKEKKVLADMIRQYYVRGGKGAVKEEIAKKMPKKKDVLHGDNEEDASPSMFRGVP